MRVNILFASLVLALASALGLSAQTVRVVFVSGQAELQRPEDSALRAVVKGETVVIGTRIVTGADGRVVLTPMPGVKSIITPNTTLVLESISEKQTSPTEVTHSAVLDLKKGAVVSDLQKSEGVAYDYNIRTVRGIAGARGTNYTVGINAAGIQTVVVTHGNIALSLADGRQVSITPGQISITQTGGSTQSVNSIKELPASDQAIAQNWAETTVAAIAAAVESGELSPEALQLALDAATGLGVTLSPETQALVDRVLSLIEKVTATEKTPTTDIKTIIEANTEIQGETAVTGFASFTAFLGSLNESQQFAIGDIIERGFDNQAALETRLQDGQFAADLVKVVDLYIELGFTNGEQPPTNRLQQLGILGGDNTTAVGADIEGLRNLIKAYQYLTETPIALDENTYHAGNGAPALGDNFFFSGQSGRSGYTLYNVSFDASEAGANMTVGATRNLIIDNTGYIPDTFITESGGSVRLIASDLIDLNNTRFSSGMANIIMEAATINLKNVDLPANSFVYLYSRDGGTANGVDGTGYYPHFGSSKVGRVNFISGVTYGGNSVNSVGNFDAHGENIYIDKLPSGQPGNPQ
ncbi:FecR family protein [Rariglobus hedericola]|uniref:FecR domain-containing protein n=1 Tax=Rariglobus hedericola TaxID=2597822 RepID=A0A556QJS7_9BACT|nr:FecR domain-containing protein [Rariglobus hedericola]TSJ76903.1 FecR domain-containing protein [Rariglobus hedericola]